MISRYDLQDSTDIPIKPPPFRGDFAEDGLSSPSISSSDDYLEGFLRPADAQDDIPIDLVILASHGSWEDMDLQLSVPQVADSLINSETICPYPDPPPVPHNPIGHSRDPSEGASGQNDSPPPSDHPHIPDSQQLRPSSQQDTGPDESYSNSSRGNHHVSGKSTGTKRKTQQLDEGARKRSRARSTLPSKENSFTALRSHFVSLPLDERLQFLSWLFEGALSRCMSDCEQGDAWSTSHSTLPGAIEQARRGSTEVQGSSRKRTEWSPEESDLLLKLRKDEKRPWAEVTRLFSEEYPGRSSGAIQVYWSTTLSKKED
ncbi:SANT/Myb-like DNA-binding domain-containing protein [Aspergillus affinis]|uniref:SANT/Myb-like DNA-binding domain-containing protein n=1 Tax=Aspergillus affinis TaxID=1070780 RepID=UPI0022FDD78A|nr:uncharacterized protein KD926_001260 [Aspergillus affinis]KAI9036872.1 hypothetical protein KD926_001260 [Aspergillus affinis]